MVANKLLYITLFSTINLILALKKLKYYQVNCNMNTIVKHNFSPFQQNQ
jgi:hypothetical protein